MDSSDSYKESVPGGGGGVLPLYCLNGDVPLDRYCFHPLSPKQGM